MKRKYKKPELDFSKITPRMQIEKAKHSKLYKKAFFNSLEKCACEFCRNTSAED